MPIEVENDEEKKAIKVVQDMLLQLQEATSVLKMMDQRIRAPKITAKLGDICPDIYRYAFYSQRDILSRLPAELQQWIWSYLPLPADRLMLALSCKGHAAVFQELKTHKGKSGPLKKSSKAAASSTKKPAVRAITQKPATKLDRIHVLTRLQDWMPKNYKLCNECIRFKSRTRSKRKTALLFTARDVWSGTQTVLSANDDEKEVNKKLKSALKSGSRCPECSERANLEVASTKKEYQKLKKDLTKLLK